jgi:hypothetical protein
VAASKSSGEHTGDQEVPLEVGRGWAGSGLRPGRNIELAASSADGILHDNKRFPHLRYGADLSYAFPDSEGQNGNSGLMGSDAPPEHYEETKGFSVSLSIDDPVDAERILYALAENGTVRMPIQKTFWAVHFGMLVDRFGIPCMMNCEQAA